MCRYFILFSPEIIVFSSLSILSVPDEGYSRNVPDEGYSRNVPDEGYSRNVPDEVIPETYLMKVIPETYLMKLFQKRVVRTKFDIYVFIISMRNNIKQNYQICYIS